MERSCEYDSTLKGDDVSSQFLFVEESIGKANSRPTATRLQEMSMPGMGQEFQA